MIVSQPTKYRTSKLQVFIFPATPAAEYSALHLRLSCRWWACTCRAWALTKCCRALPSQSKWALQKQTLTGPLPFIRLHLKSLSQCANANSFFTIVRLFSFFSPKHRHSCIFGAPFLSAALPVTASCVLCLTFCNVWVDVKHKQISSIIAVSCLME